MGDKKSNKSKGVGGRGGYRPGAGRPKGAANKANLERIAAASEDGLLPHEILLMVARGEPDIIDDGFPSTTLRVEAAKAAAPYYAPKLSSMEFKPTDGEGNHSPIQFYLPSNGRESN